MYSSTNSIINIRIMILAELKFVTADSELEL